MAWFAKMFNTRSEELYVLFCVQLAFRSGFIKPVRYCGAFSLAAMLFNLYELKVIAVLMFEPND